MIGQRVFTERFGWKVFGEECAACLNSSNEAFRPVANGELRRESGDESAPHSASRGRCARSRLVRFVY